MGIIICDILEKSLSLSKPPLGDLGAKRIHPRTTDQKEHGHGSIISAVS